MLGTLVFYPYFSVPRIMRMPCLRELASLGTGVNAIFSSTAIILERVYSRPSVFHVLHAL